MPVYAFKKDAIVCSIVLCKPDLSNSFTVFTIRSDCATSDDLGEVQPVSGSPDKVQHLSGLVQSITGLLSQAQPPTDPVSKA